METRSVEAVVRALEDANVRYMVAGGLAVVAHGYLRFTKDIDLVVALDEDNSRRALKALVGLGYRPAVPVALWDFLDPVKRRDWIENKNARVFPLVSDAHPLTPVEIFLEEPFEFENAYGAAVKHEVAPGLAVAFVSLEDLIAMKRGAGREQDLADVAELERLRRG